MTAKKTAPKTDKVQVKNDLDKLASEVSTDHEPYEFWFKGTRFVTQNPYDLDLAESMKVSDTDIEGQLELFLGDDYDKFMELKPQMKHASALVQNANQYYEEAFGNPGESDGSQTS